GRRRWQQGTVDVRLPSALGWERVAMDAAATVARRMGFPAERIEDIKTAVSEATVNAIEHGNAGDASQEVLVVLAPLAHALEIEVHDRAAMPFGPRVQAPGRPDLAAMVEGQATARGWGVFLIRSLVDQVEFSSTGDGNLVRMVIRLDSVGA